jgi:hypothetical protein
MCKTDAFSCRRHPRNKALTCHFMRAGEGVEEASSILPGGDISSVMQPYGAPMLQPRTWHMAHGTWHMAHGTWDHGRMPASAPAKVQDRHQPPSSRRHQLRFAAPIVRVGTAEMRWAYDAGQTLSGLVRPRSPPDCTFKTTAAHTITTLASRPVGSSPSRRLQP